MMDPNSGFCSKTRTYHSLRPIVHDPPPPSQPLSITEYVFSLLHRHRSSSSSTATSTTVSDPATFMINNASGQRLTYSDLLHQTNSLAISLSKGDIAFILSHNSLRIPILYFSLLSLGVIISPAIPVDTSSDITHLLNLSRPGIVFATSETSHKLININPTWNCRTVLTDSPEFLSLLTRYDDDNSVINHRDNVVNQSDIAAIIY
ncbi:hypothetical protein Dsin_014388 [Dipteronia sinensis]|uniref:AMP-dependent synthetase/ligase domain-containing protein n=1 Tax=Dipteronia sinensis TaxID=43782 RepID=A0AAE0E9S8_9ROSI|nr:hypothetical protein Dsin_014388 [Dipteronia sinensis]